MNIDVSPGSRNIRSFNGCWTCRLRRKKCDERRPVCEICASLHITCHFGQEKPEWMDGGARQEQMAARFKQEVKDNAHRRREERTDMSGDSISTTAGIAPRDGTSTEPDSGLSTIQRTPDGNRCPLVRKDVQGGIRLSQSDTILLMFYLENVLPFLFPFYHPSIVRGGRAWILEMMINSPVVCQATLCLSPYFFSLAQGTDNDDALWEKVLTRTRDAFVMLSQALQIINSSGIAGHLPGAVRIMASIVQLQRYEIAVLSLGNCEAHHNAALALFEQLLESVRPAELTEPCASFDAVLDRLGAASLSEGFLHIPSAEQAAFLFSSTLLVFDDIVASTVLPERPRLYDYHKGLLGNTNGAEPRIDLETILGCQNWVLLQIGEISALDAWKQQCKRDGSLDVMELVHQATVIKRSLESQLTHIEAQQITSAGEYKSVLDILTADENSRPGATKNQTYLVTQVWGHAALLYLFVVVSGWQPANSEVRHHVSRIIELLSSHISQPSLLRTMTWPFSVAGCLAEPMQEAHFRAMTEKLKPPSVFGTVYKAFEMMEKVWRRRDTGDAATRDLATCFRTQCHSSNCWFF
ncbi:fungal-specific transcription factor domain-containing protein [Xylaria flabelliformis]|nr:fungal-specific transcription factor domain-containing protein [Xylaria flabelliformis]